MSISYVAIMVEAVYSNVARTATRGRQSVVRVLSVLRSFQPAQARNGV